MFKYSKDFINFLKIFNIYKYNTAYSIEFKNVTEDKIQQVFYKLFEEKMDEIKNNKDFSESIHEFIAHSIGSKKFYKLIDNFPITCKETLLNAISLNNKDMNINLKSKDEFEKLISSVETILNLSTEQTEDVFCYLLNNIFVLEKLNIDQLNNLIVLFQNIESDKIYLFVNAVFSGKHTDFKFEIFEPPLGKFFDIEEDISINIEKLTLNIPEYDFIQTYSFLKHPCFNKSIKLLQEDIIS